MAKMMENRETLVRLSPLLLIISAEKNLGVRSQLQVLINQKRGRETITEKWSKSQCQRCFGKNCRPLRKQSIRNANDIRRSQYVCLGR